jgi:outer membrane immunogenic protein
VRKIASVAAVIALTGPVYAADLPLKAPAMAPVEPIAPSWTGFYIGGHGGLGWKSLDGTFSDPNGVISGPINVSSGSHTGAVGGFHAGYNWQFAAAWVAGIEGDISLQSSKSQQFHFCSTRAADARSKYRPHDEFRCAIVGKHPG